MNAPIANASAGAFMRAKARAAWTAFWQEGQTQCVSAAPDVGHELRKHWTAFALTLSPRARVLDLGCGAGAVARTLTAVRRDVHVTGVDFATLPLTINRHFDLLSDTAMEAMPFTDASFAAAVSQFGYEYSQTKDASAEIARVLAPGAQLSLLVHHADSAILAESRARLAAFKALFASRVGSAFCNGDQPTLARELSHLDRSNDVIVQLERTLPLRISRAERERLAIWKAVDDALAPEMWMLEALCQSCVSARDLTHWLSPLNFHFAITATSVILEPNGAAIAWLIGGVRNG